jgi:hypothetical protein
MFESIQRFRNPEKLSGEGGYYLSSLVRRKDPCATRRITREQNSLQVRDQMLRIRFDHHVDQERDKRIRALFTSGKALRRRRLLLVQLGASQRPLRHSSDHRLTCDLPRRVPVSLGDCRQVASRTHCRFETRCSGFALITT